MSSPLICHFSPKGGIDDRISAHLNKAGLDRMYIGALRNLYDMENSTPLISPLVDESSISDDDMHKAAETLMKYRNTMAQRHLQDMKDTTKHPAKAFSQLYKVEGWNVTTRRNRVSMVATLFSNEVSRRLQRAAEAGSDVSREDIVNGYKVQGRYQDGQASIFEAVFDALLNDYTAASRFAAQAEGVAQEKIDALPEAQKRKLQMARNIVAEYPKIFQNWAALCTFARMSLRDTEGLKINDALNYAAPVNTDNLSMDSPLEEHYDLEESVKEAWQQHQASISAFASLGNEVRRFLSTIMDVDAQGNEMRDNLGTPIFMDPVELHRYLADILRGTTSETNMIKKLQALSADDPRMGAVFRALAKAAQADLSIPFSDENRPKYPVILTQLLLDMHKNLILYSALRRSKRSGNIFATILNKQHNSLHDDFTLRMQLHQVFSEVNSIYDKNGYVNWDSLAQWNVDTAKMIPNTQDKGVGIFNNLDAYGNSEFFKLRKPDKINFLMQASRAIGIAMDEKTATRIITNRKALRSYLDALRDFRTETKQSYYNNAREVYNHLQDIENFYKTSNPTAEQSQKRREAIKWLNDQKITYEQFRAAKYGKTSEIGMGNEKIRKALDVVATMSSSMKTERRVPWFDKNGNTNSRYSDRTPSYMGDLVGKIHEFVENGDAQGLKAYMEDKWGQSSFFYDAENKRFRNKWLQEIYSSFYTDTYGNLKIDKDALAQVFAFDEFLGSNIDGRVNIFENFTERQHTEAMLKQFMFFRDNSNSSTLCKYPCFILGDSGAQMFFTAKHYSTNQILTGLKEVFWQEFERIKYVNATNNFLLKEFADKYGFEYTEQDGKVTVQKDGKTLSAKELKDLGYRPIANFSETANEFTMLKFLNKDFQDGKYWRILTGKTSNEDISSISAEEAIEEAREAINTDALEKALNEYMKDALQEFKEKLVSVGVLKKMKGEDGAITYIDGSGKKGFLNKEVSKYDNVEKFIEDFFWNTKYATIQQLQMFTVDPAFYDHRYPIKDLQKRYKEIYAPGKGVSLEARDFNGNLYATRPQERVAYFDDIGVSSEDVNPLFMSMIEKEFADNPDVIDMYKNNTLTDGQGYRSLKSYRTVMGMAALWTPSMESIYNRIMDIRQEAKDTGRSLSEAELAELSSLAVKLQPIKPYLFTLEKVHINDSDVALVPVQHKYAEIVLIPELMQEGKLKELAKWMEEKDVDMVASDKCVKVGSFGGAILKGANSAESVWSAMDKAFIHELDWADYRIQSGVPEHLNHAQLFGTQIRKLILANINKDAPYTKYLKNIFKGTSFAQNEKVYIPGVGSVNFNGGNLVALYNSLIMANLFDDYERLVKDVGNTKSLSDKMLQNIVSNANQAEDNAFGLSLIEEGSPFAGEFVIPPGEPGMEHDAGALLMSLFKKGVNKQRILGGSAVQASAMGLSGWTEAGNLFEVVSPEGDNVLYDEIEMPFNRTYTTSKGETVALKFEDWCYTDPEHYGELKLSDKIVYGEEAREYLSWPVGGRDEHGQPLVGKDKDGYAKEGYYVPLIETKYPGILDIIAYRIPTERDYSMINAKVFRFSNPLAGGTLKVPSSRTTTAGFDFDIDKLYFFMKEYAHKELSKKQIKEIWDKIYQQDEYKEFAEALRDKVDSNKTGDYALSIYKEIFHNSPILKEVTQKEAYERNLDFWELVKQEDETGRFDHIPATAEEAFNKYLENHRREYPLFEVYDPTVSPLNPVMGEKGEVVTKGNTRAARNNLLMDLMRQRLMDKETLKARYTPGGFEANRDAALRMRVLLFADRADISENGHLSWSKVDEYIQSIKNKERKDPEPEYDVSDPTAILVYNQQNQVAGKLIGIFANQNTNHVYASTLNSFTLSNPILFGDHTFRGLSDFLHAPEGVDVDTNVAEYLAASVDAVKDPVLNFLNLNLVTADAGAVLARIGYTPREIGLLFNQPIIRELCDYVANEGTSTDMGILEMLKRYGGKNASLKDIKYQPANASTETLAENILQQRRFDETGTERTKEFEQGQLQVLWLFNEIMADAADVSSFVQATRFTAANSVGSTWGDLIAQESRIKQFVTKYLDKGGDTSDSLTFYSKKGIQDAKDKRRLKFQLYPENYAHSNRIVHIEDAMGVEEDYSGSVINLSPALLKLSPEEYMAQMSKNPFAFEQCMMDLERKAARELFSQYFPHFTKLYSDMRGIMNSLSRYGSLNADTVNSLHRDFIVYLLSKQKGSDFDGESWSGYMLDNRRVSNREYYTKIFPTILANAKSSGVLSHIPFFDYLTIDGDYDANASTNPLKIFVQGMGGLQSRTSNIVTEQWATAFNSTEVVSIPREDGSMIDMPVSELAKGLYFYNFYKLGYNFHPTAFMNLVPTILKLGLRVDNESKEEGKDRGYISFIRDVIKGKIKLDPTDFTEFAQQYMLNHTDNNSLIFKPTGTAKAPIVKKAFQNNAWQSEFTISYKELGRDTGSLFLLPSSTKEEYAFRPVIAVELDNGVTEYYMADSSDPSGFNITPSASGVMKYRKVREQGRRGENIQYFGHAAFSQFQATGSPEVQQAQSSTPTTTDTASVDSAPVDTDSQGAQDTGTDVDQTGEGVRTEMFSQFVEIGTPAKTVQDMFTDAEWKGMFNIFKKEHKEMFTDLTTGYDYKQFRDAISDTSDLDNIQILRDLERKLKKGELKTIDENGKEIDACPV